MTVMDLIGSRSDVFSIRDDVTVHDAARYLRERQVRSVGVLDANGTLVGVVSQSDVSDKVQRPQYGTAISSPKIPGSASVSRFSGGRAPPAAVM